MTLFISRCFLNVYFYNFCNFLLKKWLCSENAQIKIDTNGFQRFFKIVMRNAIAGTDKMQPPKIVYCRCLVSFAPFRVTYGNGNKVHYIIRRCTLMGLHVKNCKNNILYGAHTHTHLNRQTVIVSMFKCGSHLMDYNQPAHKWTYTYCVGL